MKRPLIIIAAISVLAACANTAGTNEMTLEEGAKQECRTVTESGSMLHKRVCNNKATWAAIDEKNKEAGQEAMRKAQDRYTPAPRDSGF